MEEPPRPCVVDQNSLANQPGEKATTAFASPLAGNGISIDFCIVVATVQRFVRSARQHGSLAEPAGPFNVASKGSVSRSNRCYNLRRVSRKGIVVVCAFCSVRAHANMRRRVNGLFVRDPKCLATARPGNSLFFFLRKGTPCSFRRSRTGPIDSVQNRWIPRVIHLQHEPSCTRRLQHYLCCVCENNTFMPVSLLSDHDCNMRNIALAGCNMAHVAPRKIFVDIHHFVIWPHLQHELCCARGCNMTYVTLCTRTFATQFM